MNLEDAMDAIATLDAQLEAANRKIALALGYKQSGERWHSPECQKDMTNCSGELPDCLGTFLLENHLTTLEERLRLATADRDRAIQLAKTFKGKIAVMPLSEESYSGYEVAKAELETLEEAIALAKLKPTTG